MKTIHRGKIKNGVFIPTDPQRWMFELAKFKPDTVVEVTIQKPRKHRSKEQNAYYWKVIIPLLSQKTGFTHQEAHDAMRAKFLTDMIDGSKTSLPRIKSTTELSTVEFMDYSAQIQQFAAEFLDLYIPDPNEFDH